MKFRDLLRIDFLLLMPVISLLVLGILFIYSAGITSAGVQVSTEYIRQTVWASAGLVIAIGLAMVNYRRFYNLSFYIYLLSLLPLVYMVIIGIGDYAAIRWLRIGGFGIQASEFVKISVIIALARFLEDTQRNDTFIRFMVACIIVFIPMGLVMLQPDLGTALVYIAILMTMLFSAGVAMRYVSFMALCILFSSIFLVLPLWQTFIFRRSVPFMAILTNQRVILFAVLFFAVIAGIALFGYLKYKKKYFYWIIYSSVIMSFSLVASYVGRLSLRNYQIMRLIIFIDPNIDPRGAGWNIIQSITAIGAGGLTGRGFLQGTQSQYRFLPEQSTDFIFSIFSEEAGFLGGIAVFLFFLIICQRLLWTMKVVPDPFAKNICAGLIGMYSFHFAINVGMAMGIMPITGIPLMFMSYGGSSILTAMIGIGLALSIFVRRHNR